MAGERVTIVVIARVPEAGRDAFESYESGVLALLPEFSGVLERRLRASDNTEVHVVSFPDQHAFSRYLVDPRRMSLAPLLKQSGAVVERLDVVDITAG